MGKKKVYVVWVGQNPGLYDQWDQCHAQVNGFPNARYKSFNSTAEAKAAWQQGWEPFWGQKKKQLTQRSITDYPEIDLNSIAVDAACSGNPGKMEYQAVDTATGKQIFHDGPFPLGTNNIGEFLAIVDALRLLEKNKEAKRIYTDSRTAISWVKKKKVNSNLIRSQQTEALWWQVDDAVHWLSTYTVPKGMILKWDTDNWGEIPADFGRK